MRIRLLVIGAAVAAATGCRNDSMSTEPAMCPLGPTHVCMFRTTFSPSVLTVPVGTTVEWRDFSGVAHTVTSSPGSAETFDVSIGPGLGISSRQFNTRGTYPYYCRNHGTPTTGMRGIIEVN